jgi:hypothetical protein
MEWPTAEIGLEGATGQESLADEWRVEQLERLGLFLDFADVFAPALPGPRWKRSSREAAHLNRLVATYQSSWGGFSRL